MDQVLKTKHIHLTWSLTVMGSFIKKESNPETDQQLWGNCHLPPTESDEGKGEAIARFGLQIYKDKYCGNDLIAWARDEMVDTKTEYLVVHMYLNECKPVHKEVNKKHGFLAALEKRKATAVLAKEEPEESNPDEQAKDDCPF